MRTREVAALAAALLVALPIAGCGDEKSNREAAYTAPDAALADAAQAKSDARNAVSRLEVCFVERQDYTKCRGVDVTSPGGNGGNQVRVARATRTTYRLEARSKSDAVFAIERSASGAMKRTCSGPGCSGGSW